MCISETETRKMVETETESLADLWFGIPPPGQGSIDPIKNSLSRFLESISTMFDLYCKRGIRIIFIFYIPSFSVE